MKLARVGNKSSHGRKCYASGGRVEEDISDPGSLPVMSGAKDDDMGGIDGGKAKPRLDRASKKASPVSVNVIVTSSKPDTGATPLPNAGPPVPPPAMGPPPGGPPPMPMRASGGRVNKYDPPVSIDNSKKATVAPKNYVTVDELRKMGPKEKSLPPVEVRANRNTGGRVMKGMDAGAGSGPGRLEKAKDYGTKPAKGK
jgi:hypothetical protein